jgi:beta-glucanase (GH16 family)
MSGTLDLQGYHLSFDWEGNDFNSSPTPGAAQWTTTLSSGLRSLGNGDQEYWTDNSTGDNPFSLSGGALTINATDVGAGNTPGGGNLSYTSGVMTTQGSFSQRYGYFEMRAQLPQGVGMWPAFWMLTNNSNQTGGWPPELDAMEAFGAPSTTGSYGVGGGSNQAHWAVHSQNASQQAGNWATVNGNIYNQYHTYGVLWSPSTLTFYYDGQQVAQTPTPSDYTLPMYLIANLAVGGYWPGNATGESGAMKIDYIRAFSNNPSDPAVPMQPISSPDGGGTNLYGATAAGQSASPPSTGGQQGQGTGATPTSQAGESADGAIVMTPGTAVVDSAGESWTITPAGQISVNGTVDPLTQGVVELEYTGHDVWQKNSWGNWYYKHVASDAWTQAPSGPPVAAPATANGTTVPLGQSSGTTPSANDQPTFITGSQPTAGGSSSGSVVPTSSAADASLTQDLSQVPTSVGSTGGGLVDSTTPAAGQIAAMNQTAGVGSAQLVAHSLAA